MQAKVVDPKTSATQDLQVQRDKAEAVSELHRSIWQTNQPTLRKLCPKQSVNVLQCQHCDYTTVHPSNFRAHSRKHTGNMLECKHCDYTTVHTSALKAHSRKHTDDMHQCQHCDFTTAYSSNLKTHHLKHTGEALLFFFFLFNEI